MNASDQSESLFGQILGEITTALGLLGADSALQAAVGSWRDTMDDRPTLDHLRAWNEGERRRLDAVIAAYRRSGWWGANAWWQPAATGQQQQSTR